MRTSVEEDAFQAWIYASNCLLYENDPGPSELNMGTADEPRMVPRAQAWQHAYALHVLVQCEADHARLTAAARQCRASMADAAARLGAERTCEWSRAADLCDQAAQMAEDAGAADNDKARRRLLTGCQHQTMMIALGSVIPAVAESSAADLQQALREIDEEPSNLPEQHRWPSCGSAACRMPLLHTDPLEQQSLEGQDLGDSPRPVHAVRRRWAAD